MNFSQFVLILLARKKFLAKVFSAVVLMVLIISLVWPKTYEATVAVVVDAKGVDSVTGMAVPAQLMPGYLATQVDIITSHNVALKVVDKLKLTEAPEIRARFSSEESNQGSIRDWYADELLKHNLDVEPSHESNMIKIVASARDPELSAQLANAFAEAYIQASLEVKVDPARRQAGWFDEQVQGLRETLERAQQRLAAFQRENNVVGTDQQHLDLENSKLADISNQLIAAQSSTYDAETRLNQMHKAVSSESAQQLPDILANPLLQNMKADLVRAEGQLAETAQRYGRNHPEYVSAAAEVTALRAKLNAEIYTARGAIVQSAQLAKQREAELQAAFDRQKAHILELQKQHDEQSVLTRDVTDTQGIYEATLQRASQVRLEGQQDQSSIAVLSAAVPPLKAAKPKLLLNFLLSIVVGGMLSIGAALVAELHDRRVHSAADLNDELGLLVLAELPGEGAQGGETSRDFLARISHKFQLVIRPTP